MVEISYLRNAFGVLEKWMVKVIELCINKFIMSGRGERMKCGVFEEVKQRSCSHM